MKTSHGMIQGYDGVAAVVARHQIIVHANAYGQAQEHGLLLPMVDGIDETFKAIGEKQIFQKAKLTADSGFHNAVNLEQLHARQIEAYIVDNQMRKRDPRFIDTDKYRARTRKEKQAFLGSNTNKTFSNKDFDYDKDNQICVCPAGKSLYRSGSNINMKG